MQVDDLIGDAVESEPGLSKRDAARVKAFLLAYQRKGGMPSLRTLIPMAWVVLKMKWAFTDVYNLYARHMSGWGAGARSYRFEGWSRGQKDWEETLGPTHAARLELSVDTDVLCEGDTWDVVRAQVRLLDANGNEVWFGATPVALEVDGPLRLQGPACRALMGGSTAYWLATTGQTGTARLRARTDRFVSDAVEIAVRL